MRYILATFIAALVVSVSAAPQPIVRKIGRAIPITKRFELVNPDKSVNVDALHTHATSVMAKISRGLANYEKNTGSSHPAALSGPHKRGAGIPLTDDYGRLWYGNVTVGTPAQSFSIDFDTGSSDIFVPASNCDSSCDGHSLYNPSLSSTSGDLGRTFKTEYGDGSSSSGELYTDTVSIAGYSATGQTIGAATKYSSGFQISQILSDGLMGMAFESLSVFSAKPVFQTLISEGQVTDPEFSFKLSSSGAELYIGGANTALYKGEFTYVSVTQEGFWEANMDGIQSNGQTILSNIDVVIDTGTSLIYGPTSQVSSLYSALGGKPAPSNIGSGYYTFNCSSFPDVSFTFGGESFSISGLNLGPASDGSSDCVSGIVGQDGGASFWIVGDLFLSNVYTKFDVGNMRVGFASLA